MEIEQPEKEVHVDTPSELSTKSTEFSPTELDSEGLYCLCLHAVILVCWVQLIKESIGNSYSLSYNSPFQVSEFTSQAILLTLGSILAGIVYWTVPRLARKYSRDYAEDFEQSKSTLLLTVLCRAGGLYLLLRFLYSIIKFISFLCLVFYNQGLHLGELFTTQTAYQMIPFMFSYASLVFCACFLFIAAEKVAWLLNRFSPMKIPSNTSCVLNDHRQVIFRGFCFLLGVTTLLNGVLNFYNYLSTDKALIFPVTQLAVALILIFGPHRLYDLFLELRKTPVKPE